MNKKFKMPQLQLISFLLLQIPTWCSWPGTLPHHNDLRTQAPFMLYLQYAPWQELEDIVFRGPESQYFKLFRLHSPALSQSHSCSAESSQRLLSSMRLAVFHETLFTRAGSRLDLAHRLSFADLWPWVSQSSQKRLRIHNSLLSHLARKVSHITSIGEN